MIHRSGQAFVHGCNYPWSTDGTTVFYGLDFGANVWGSHVGVSTRRPAVSRDFAAMAALGFTVVRWFVFCDGRSGIVYDEAGVPWSLDSHVLVDLDAALEIAGDHGIALSLVLLDHQWMFGGLPGLLPDAATGAMHQVSLPSGRARILAERESRNALFERVLAPVVSRYGPSGSRNDLAHAVFAWEFMNEPDFVVEEWEQDLSRRVTTPIRFDALAEQVSRLSDLVHRESRAQTTLAAARLRNLWAWDDDGLGLDFLQVHTYPDLAHPFRDEDVFGKAATALGCHRPVVLGEFPGNGPMRHPAGASPPAWTLDDYLSFGLAGGYGGAWAWSFSGTDAYGRLPVEPLLRFAAEQPELVNKRAGLPGGTVNESERS